MSAYNWIVLESTCPSCTKLAIVRCQTHIASDYGGNGDGRFHDREYRLGDVMAWWSTTDPKFADWSADGTECEGNGARVEEACYSTCLSCSAKLCAVIRFQDRVPESLVAVTKEEDWPKGYLR